VRLLSSGVIVAPAGICLPREKSTRMKAAMFQSKRIDPQLLESYRSQSGRTIRALSQDRPLLLVFLRHFG
jgi:hypothetical protein